MIGLSTTTKTRKKGPERTCIGCRAQANQARLLRLVRSEDGEVWVDHPHRLGGRGAYICSSLQCLSRAIGSPQLNSALGGDIKPPQLLLLSQQIVDRIKRRIKGLLATAGRTGHVVLGAQKTEEALKTTPTPFLVVLATNLSSRVQRAIENAAEKAQVKIERFVDLDELGSVFARSELGALAVKDNGLAKALYAEFLLLKGISTTKIMTETSSKEEEKVLERAT